MSRKKKTRIAIMASGNGSNAQKIIEHFFEHKKIEVAILISNKANAFALERAKASGIATAIIPSEQWKFNQERVLEVFKKHEIDFIVLAGYLLLIPDWLLQGFEQRIINIHPALLPSYGGKGMYGDKVHKTIIESGEKESGITIHFVNQEYDKGEIIYQAKCKVSPEDTPESLAEKIHALEHMHYPSTIESVIEETESE